jgi:hypothetical protein
MERQQEIGRALAPYGVGELKHERRLHSSVTTSWGVDWDEEMIARDLMQNFFDSDRARIAEVKVEVTGSGATVSAPTPYNLERLYYLGSEKGLADVGQYGEGFKAAAVSLFRKYRHAVLAAASGDQVLRIHVDDSPVGATEMHPLVYDFFRTTSSIPGNRLIVGGAGPRMAQALKDGLNHFLYPGNPILSAELAKDRNCDFIVYRATTPDGHIFYRSLKRGDIPDIPLVLVLNKPYKRIEQKVASDRDRKAFGDELRQLFYQHFAQYFFNQWDRQRIVLEAARPLWEAGRGHPLLAEIAERARHNPWRDQTAAEVFGNRFFARSHSTRPDEQLRYLQIEQTWSREGRTSLPTYFRRFGVISAARHCAEVEWKARREAQDKGAPAGISRRDRLPRRAARELERVRPRPDALLRPPAHGLQRGQDGGATGRTAIAAGLPIL